MKELYIKKALECAKKSLALNEIPVGAVIVKDGKIISTGYNKKEKNKSVLEHAELIAIRKASKVLKNWRLNDCEMYVTLEPCEMCASAIKQSRISTVYSGLSNDDENIHNRVVEILQKDKSNPQVTLINDCFREESYKLLKEFFISTRKK